MDDGFIPNKSVVTMQGDVVMNRGGYHDDPKDGTRFEIRAQDPKRRVKGTLPQFHTLTEPRNWPSITVKT